MKRGSVAKQAPFLIFDFREFLEEIGHNAAIKSIMEGIKVKVVEVGEKVEGW